MKEEKRNRIQDAKEDINTGAIEPGVDFVIIILN